MGAVAVGGIVIVVHPVGLRGSLHGGTRGGAQAERPAVRTAAHRRSCRSRATGGERRAGRGRRHPEGELDVLDAAVQPLLEPLAAVLPERRHSVGVIRDVVARAFDKREECPTVVETGAGGQRSRVVAVGRSDGLQGQRGSADRRVRGQREIGHRVGSRAQDLHDPAPLEHVGQRGAQGGRVGTGAGEAGGGDGPHREHRIAVGHDQLVRAVGAIPREVAGEPADRHRVARAAAARRGAAVPVEVERGGRRDAVSRPAHGVGQVQHGEAAALLEVALQ